MADRLLKSFSVEVKQTLYEKEFASGVLTVYQTYPLGVMMIFNGEPIISEYDGFFYHEMLTHPALFSHPHPQKIAIIGEPFGMLPEILKHPSIKQIDCMHFDKAIHETFVEYFSFIEPHDPRVQYVETNSGSTQYDLLILSSPATTYLTLDRCAQWLNDEGIMVKPAPNALFYPKLIKPLYTEAKSAGFRDWQLLNFLQASSPFGNRSLFLATKCPVFKRLRERDIFNRPFATRYYNYDIHQAALVLPEFVRSELII